MPTALESAQNSDRTVVDYNGVELKLGSDESEPIVLVNVHDIAKFKEWMKNAELSTCEVSQ